MIKLTLKICVITLLTFSCTGDQFYENNTQAILENEKGFTDPTKPEQVIKAPESDEIFDFIYSKIDKVDNALIEEKLKDHYEFFHITVSDQWFLKEFKERSSYFLDYSKANLKAHWAKIRKILKNDHDFSKFAKQLNSETKENILSQLSAYDDEEIIDILTYGFALEKINKLLLEDSELFLKHMEILSNEPNPPLNSMTSFVKNIFLIVKMYSVKWWMNKVSDVFENKGGLNPNAISIVLQGNILEAMTLDGVMQNFDNAMAGWALTRNSIRDVGPDAITRSKDEKLFLIDMPKTNEWVSLYSTWNMAFCSQFLTCPILIQKLMIPSVLGFSQPNEYMHRRAVALYLSVRYLTRRMEKINPSNDKTCTWSLTSLTKEWGKFNREAATDYKKNLGN